MKIKGNDLMKLWTGVILIILAGGLAYFAGNSLGDFLSKKKTADFLTNREQKTENILKEHVQLGVGDTLPDYAFETLDFDTVTFSECLSDNSILRLLTIGHPEFTSPPLITKATTAKGRIYVYDITKKNGIDNNWA